ncbi:DDE-type integrase/transposase/recombinase [Ixodes scapularis]
MLLSAALSAAQPTAPPGCTLTVNAPFFLNASTFCMVDTPDDPAYIPPKLNDESFFAWQPGTISDACLQKHSTQLYQSGRGIVTETTMTLFLVQMAFAYRYITPFPRFERTLEAPGRVRASVVPRARPVGSVGGGPRVQARRAAANGSSVCAVHETDPSGRLARWSLRLQEFDVAIVHKSGRKHNDADCLSRAPVESPPESTDDDDDARFLGAVTDTDMGALQRDDPELRCDRPPRRSRKFSSASLGPRLVKLRSAARRALQEELRNEQPAWLLVIPASLREEIFQACHDDPTAGHLGYSRTLARIREKYYWPKLAKTVHHYTRSCHECQRRKKPPTRPAGLLQPIPPPSAPFQQIGMDLLGPFPPSTQGNRWIIVATDYLTRYAETKALPSGTAVEVAKFFIESIVLRHGAPEVLISDRGSSFMAQLTQEVLRLSHTSHRRTTAYHPQTNGLTERLNKTIADMISMYVDVEHKTWDEVLPYVTFAYNTAVQETTGVTPFQLVHGRKVTTMLDAMLPHEPAVDASDDAQVVAQRAEEVRQLARLRIKANNVSTLAATTFVVGTSTSSPETGCGCGHRSAAAVSARNS